MAGQGISETELYEPVKRFLEGLEYEVKGEICGADVTGLRGDDLVVVELKTGFSLTLLRQGIARQALTDLVYVAVPRPAGRAGVRALKGNAGLCKRLGLGLLLVRLKDGHVEPLADPEPYRPRKSPARRARLLAEFRKRTGDPTVGGGRGKVMTAYRQDAIACRDHLAAQGPTKGSEVAKATGVTRATRIMADNHYGWFVRVETGIYALSELENPKDPAVEEGSAA